MKHLSLLRTLLSLAAVMTIALSARGQGCNGDTNGDGKVDGIDLAVVLGQWGPCPAVISSVTPSHGSVLGGTVITISGSGLAATSSVTIGGAVCTNLVLISATQVQATTPPGVAGNAPIQVTTPGGTSVAPSPFQYVLQSVTSIEPSSGPFNGGTAITITGQYLTGTTSVTIGGVPATNLVVVNSTKLTVTTPAGSVGAADVVVTGTKGTVTVPGGFVYASIFTPPWATLLEATPDPAVVPDVALRNAITATGLAWRVVDTATQIEMLLVPPGTFNMGCSASNQQSCDSDENPVHEVTLTNAFYMGRYEVTQAQWIAKGLSNPSCLPGLPNSGNRPVSNVRWDTVDSSFLPGTGLRLPTEAEWEYAYRAGTITAFHSMPEAPNGTNDDALVGGIAWYFENASNPMQVGGKEANGLGIHDMSGNVAEWVFDRYQETYYSVSPPVNPPGPPAGGGGVLGRVIRGGHYTSWKPHDGLLSEKSGLRSSDRWWAWENFPDCRIGFRVARSP